jgi:dCTP diphosphatase
MPQVKLLNKKEIWVNDTKKTVEQLKLEIKEFMEKREWEQYHTPKNMSMQIAAEAAELMEPFLFVESAASRTELEKKRQAVEHEVADVAICLLNFCVRSNIDLVTAIANKMVLNAQKYPVEKCKGKRTKYDEL